MQRTNGHYRIMPAPGNILRRHKLDETWARVLAVLVVEVAGTNVGAAVAVTSPLTLPHWNVSGVGVGRAAVSPAPA